MDQSGHEKAYQIWIGLKVIRLLWPKNLRKLNFKEYNVDFSETDLFFRIHNVNL